MKAAPFDYLRPGGTEQAVAALVAAGEGAKVCAGSQSLGAMLNLRLVQVDQLVDVGRIDALRAFELLPQALRIGSAVTHARIEDGALPDVTCGLLPTVAASIAYRAVRNRGTLGGSLAHADPAADWVTTMCLLDAEFTLLGPAGQRTLRAADFFLGPFTTALAPDELLTAVTVPRFSPDARWAYRKQCRKPGEFAEATVAVWIDPSQGVARLVLGALDGMPHVVQGEATLVTLAAVHHPHTGPAALARLLADAGVDDPYNAELLTELLRLAWADVSRPAAAPAAESP